jgi:choline-sulfatase
MKRLSLLMLLLPGCVSRHAPVRADHIVIVTLDTTRADYLTAYGSVRVSTPNLDRVARSGIVFEQATTVAPLTLTAHCSLFTGLLPPHHGVRDNGDEPLAIEHATLAEVLHARGFRTAAFVGSAVLQANRGLARGFDVYRDGVPERRWDRWRVRRAATEVVDEAVDWLDRETGSPFFFWVHLYDAHAPYDLPEPYRALYRHDPYAGAIAFADSQIGRLLDALEQRRLLDRTAVVIAADHGESFGDHGEQGHGLFVYENVLRIPLVVRVPGVAPRRVARVTSLVDVMPTVLDFVGAPAPRVDGASLAGFLMGAATPIDHEAYSETLYPQRVGRSPLRALRDGRFKLIEAPRPELYDLQADPSEERNMVAERTALATAMAERLIALGGARSTLGAGSSAVSAEVRERLAALGYTSR